MSTIPYRVLLTVIMIPCRIENNNGSIIAPKRARRLIFEIFGRDHIKMPRRSKTDSGALYALKTHVLSLTPSLGCVAFWNEGVPFAQILPIDSFDFVYVLVFFMLPICYPKTIWVAGKPSVYRCCKHCPWLLNVDVLLNKCYCLIVLES